LITAVNKESQYFENKEKGDRRRRRRRRRI
jgi:hypothetical protein